MFTNHEERNNDPLPDSFATEEEAGEFWDTHSLTDYEEHLEAADDVTFEISERVFETMLKQQTSFTSEAYNKDR